MRGIAGVGALLCTLVVLEGCCSDEAVESVYIEVVDGSGNIVTDATVRFRVDGGPWRDAECAAGDCDAWTAGREEVGDFEIEATDGTITATKTVPVAAGSCHVGTQTTTMILE